MNAYDKLIDVLWSIEDEPQMDIFLKMVRNFGRMILFYNGKLYDNLFYCSPWMISACKKELEKYKDLVDEMAAGLDDETNLKLNEMKMIKDIVEAPPSKVKIKGFRQYEE